MTELSRFQYLGVEFAPKCPNSESQKGATLGRCQATDSVPINL